MATVDEVQTRLEQAGVAVAEVRELPNGQHQLWPAGFDGCVNVWGNGTCTTQGTQADALADLLGDLVGRSRRRKGSSKTPVVAAPPGGPGPRGKPPEVFVVYGHDGAARTQLDAMLRRWGFEPLILDQLPSEGATIIEKLERYQSNAGFGVVLATPDDPSPSDGLFRARQNVVLELGMLLTKLGRSRVAILLKNAASMERPSDIDGLIYLSFKDDVEEIKVSLAKEMEARGFEIAVGRL